MLKNLLFGLLSIVLTLVNGQNVKLDWAKVVGSQSNERGADIATDSFGNVYITGSFWGTNVDFDPGQGVVNLSSNGASDFFIQKLDSTGNLLWVKGIGGTGADAGLSIATDMLGNVYVTGYFNNTVDFDPGLLNLNLTSNGGEDIFVLKLNGNGNLVWAKSMGSTIHSDFGNGITVDSFGFVYVTGFYSNTVDFDPGVGLSNLTSKGVYDLFVLKLDFFGNFIWSKSVGGIGTDEGEDIVTDNLGNVYVSGNFSATADFDPDSSSTINLTSKGKKDICVLKLNSNGDYMWAKAVGANVGDDYGWSIASDGNGGIYTSGYFFGSVDFDPSATVNIIHSQGNSDIYVLKLDTAGNFIWARGIGGPGNDVAFSMGKYANSGLYFTGSFEDTVDFDPQTGQTLISAKGLNDIFVLKLDTAGSLAWVKTMSGAGYGFGMGVTAGLAENVLVTGEFEYIIDFDPSINVLNYTSVPHSFSTRDMFILKLSPCVSTNSHDSIWACKSYTWMDSITYTSSNSSATYTLLNAAGCDSVITLQLVVNKVNTQIIQQGSSFFSAALGASYQWLDCNTKLPIPGEINREFKALQNGSYAVVVTENGCSDTSACQDLSNISVSGHSFFSGVKVYPNPANGMFFISLEEFNNAIIRIYDAYGKLILEYKNTGNEQRIESLPIPGIYMIEIWSRGEKTSFRLVNN